MYNVIETPTGEIFSFVNNGENKIKYTLNEDTDFYVGSYSIFELYGDNYRRLKKYNDNVDDREFTFRLSCTENTPYIFQGYFTIFDCDWCEDECKVTVNLLERENYKDLIEANEELNILNVPPITIPRYSATTIDPNDSVTGITIDNFMKLEDVILYLAKQEASYIVGLQSDFLTNPINPISGLANKYKDIYLIEKSDVIDWNATNNATILNLSFLGLINDVCSLLNLKWWVDGYTLRIEHASFNYFENEILDLEQLNVIKMDNCYTYNTDEINKGIKLQLQEGNENTTSINWVEKQITYLDSFGRVIKNNNQYKDVNLNDLCTDFKFMLTDGKTENLDGYALAIIDGGVLESQVIGAYRFYNESLSLDSVSFLHENISKLVTSNPDYLIHYNSLLPRKEQQDIVIKYKCKDLKELPKVITRIKTNLGIGIIFDYEYDTFTCQLTINAKIY